MNVSPFIRPIQVQGGTFFTMSSASEDLGSSFNNDGKQFKFSKYALLNIPNIDRPKYPAPNQENVIQLDAIPGAFQYVVDSKTYNTMLAESFQNYALNLETMLTQYSTYNVNSLQTVAERVFFKWIKEMGGIRFREASTAESPLTAGLRFTEEDSSQNYTRVVQYISEIDVVNSVKDAAGSFSEVYIHVPTKDGATPLVLFKSLNDTNYFPAENVISQPSNPLNTSFLYGRSYTDTNPTGLDIHAFFDSPNGTYGATVGATAQSLPPLSLPGEYQLLTYNASISSYVVGWWFEYPEANSYWTQPPGTDTTFDDPRNDSFEIIGVKSDGSNATVNFQRSRLDGIMLDFNTADYYPIASNPAIQSFSDFNSLAQTASFDFNAVLVYYDLTNLSTGESATNLFGVLFLDDVQETSSGAGSIPTITKFKPNTVTGLNGNSFGFKLNLKFDIDSNNTAIVSSVNEYAPFSMQLFVDALNELQASADTLTSQVNVVNQLSTEVNSLSSLVYSSADYQALESRVAALENQLLTASAIFQNSQTVMDLIQRNYNEILNIYANKTSVTVSYNTDVLVPGDGITLDKSVPNQVIISNTEEGYTLGTSPLYSITGNFVSTPSAWVDTVALQAYANYFKISNGSAMTLDRDIYILIDDTNQVWTSGQTFKIVVDRNFPIDMYSNGSFDLIVYTDASDRLKSGQAYSKEIGRISSNNFYVNGGYAQMEIICIDPKLYTFTYDVV